MKDRAQIKERPTLKVPGFQPVTVAGLDEARTAHGEMRRVHLEVAGSPIREGTIKYDGRNLRISHNSNIWNGRDLFHGRTFAGEEYNYGQRLEKISQGG